MRLELLLTAALALAPAMLADGPEDNRGKLAGTWQVQDPSGKGETWVIEEKADAIHMARTENSEHPDEFECNTLGKECAVKLSGKTTKISMWYSGPKLVELETRGSDVVKRSFTVTQDGDTLELETLSVVPAGKPEVVRLKRVEVSAASK